MNKEEILAMKAGGELDALVEERLFNHQCEMRYCNWLPGGYFEVQSYGEGKEVVGGGLLDENELHPCYREGEKWVVTPFYSTDISAAWQVVKKMVDSDDSWDFAYHLTEVIQIPIHKHSIPDVIEHLLIKLNPEAICKAALITRLEE